MQVSPCIQQAGMAAGEYPAAATPVTATC